MHKALISSVSSVEKVLVVTAKAEQGLPSTHTTVQPNTELRTYVCTVLHQYINILITN